MKRLLVLFFALSSVPSLASADEPALAVWTKRRVEDKLVKPLRESESEGSRFSRGRPPPRERRVRVTQTATLPDKRGRGFVAFSVDVRFGSEKWRLDDIVGCAYRDKGELFVKIGDGYRPAAYLLGKDVAAVAGACEAAPNA